MAIERIQLGNKTNWLLYGGLAVGAFFGWRFLASHADLMEPPLHLDPVPGGLSAAAAAIRAKMSVLKAQIRAMVDAHAPPADIAAKRAEMETLRQQFLTARS